MADTLIKMKTGTINKLAQKDANGRPVVPLEEGTVYFAVDAANEVGKIVYDAPDGSNGIVRVVMGSQAARANNADHADVAEMASQLTIARSIDGVNFNGTADISHYGVCGTGASTAAKVVNCSGFALKTGAWIAVRFNTTNSASTNDLTLNVSGTGAKGIRYRNAVLPKASDLGANRTYLFVYDGTYYQLVGDQDTNTDTTYDYADSAHGGLMSKDYAQKLDGIAANAEVNQNAFSNVKVGSTTLSADTKTDTVELVGSNVTLTPDATNDKVTIGITKNNVINALGYTPPTQNTTYGVATTDTDGLMSHTDKTHFDQGITIAGNNVAIGGILAANTLRTSLGLSNAMHFIGVATVAITDGSTTDPGITGYSTKTAGDVVIDKNSSREYV